MSTAFDRRALDGPSELMGAFRQCTGALISVGVFSAVVNVLSLTGSVYMLQVYDRVIPSHSVPTLIGITVLMVGLYCIYGLLDFIRLRVLTRIGSRFDRLLQHRIFELSLAIPLRMGPESSQVQPTRDLEQIRTFISGSGPTAFFDLPWLPVYLLLVYFLHPYLGLLATAGAIVSVILTLIAEFAGRSRQRRAGRSVISRRAFAESARRNAEVVRAMGLTNSLSAIWAELSETFLVDQRRISDLVGGSGSISRVWRMTLQSLMLGLGAYVVMQGEASPGVIIASSIMTSRALAPVDTAIANWRGFISARQSYTALRKLMASLPSAPKMMPLPKPTRALAVDSLSVAAPGQPRPIVQNVSFALPAGSGLGIIGASGSGKSTLVRALVATWRPLRGSIRLDDATPDQWNSDTWGGIVGYLPQDIELFDGTIAENISRFDRKGDAAKILAAAEAAGAATMILRLTEGFETRIGEGGLALSGGQRQLVALARALYGDPFLVVLDEPNSNLDAEGDVALATAIANVRQRKGIVVVVAHRPSALTNVDQIMFMANGTVQAFGPRDEVLAKVVRAEPPKRAANAGDAPRGDVRPINLVPLHEKN